MKNRIKLLVLPLVLWVVATAHGQFVTTWQTDLGGSSCGSCLEITTSPLYSYSYDVDWDNDGVYDDIGVTGDISNTYPTAGQVTIAIRGTFPAFAGGLDASKLISVDDWGGLAWQDLSFANCDNLVSTPTSVAPDLSAVTSLASCFASCNSFNSAIGHWDVSNIADFSYMFNGAPSFDQDLSSWNLASAFTLQAMFLNASSFNQDLSAWDVSNIEFLGAMFVEASSFDQSLGAWTFAPNVNFRLFGATGFLEDSGMSCENFSTTLIGWARNPAMPDNRDFGSVFPLEYGEGAATAAFNYLTFQKGWNFANAFEGSCSNNCESPFPLSIQTVMPSSDGSVQVELVDGSPPYEGSIDGSQIGQYNTDQFTITGLAPGPHTLLVVDGAFCADEATFTIPEVSTSLVISEIMYNPPELGEDSLEYLNITNAGNTPIDLQGASVAAIDFTFGNVSIAPSEVITICKDSVALRQTFIIPTSQRLYQYIGSLANMGETIILQDTGGDILDSLTYRTTMPWPSNGAGDGYAIALCALVADNADGANWQRSTRDVCQDINNLALHGSPLLLSACDTCYDVCRIPVALPVGGPCEVNGQMGTLDGFCRCILDNTAALEITVWHDSNGDGEQQKGAGDECGEDLLDANEAMFRLLDSGAPATDANGNPVVFMNMAGGIYRAENLAPGTNYALQAFPDATGGWQITLPHFDGSISDIGDGDADSDFDQGSGQSPVFEILPGDTKVNIDLGMWQFMTLGGFVFFSNDCRDCNYVGVSGQGEAANVVVNLWGEEPVGSGNFTLNLGQTQSAVDGTYEFANLPPGDYRIELDKDAFQPGGQFEVFMPLPLCDDPNNDNSNENDGEGAFNGDGGVDINFARMRSGCEPDGGGTENRTFDIGICFEFDCSATNQQYLEDQCTTVDPTNPDHNTFFPICDVFILDQFCATMTSGTSPGPQPSPLCSNGGVPNNISWFSFVAGTGDYQIEVVPGNCTSVGGQVGISNGIYSDCTFSEEVQCQGQCSTAPIAMNSQDPPGSGNYQLEPCEVYFWFLDGCNGSVCDFEINVLGTFEQCDPDAPTDLICTGTSSLDAECLGSLCPGETLVLDLEGFELEGVTYNWSVTPDDGQWTINNSHPEFTIPTLTLVPNLDITFDPILAPGDSITYTVCWENIRSKCVNTEGPMCKDVVVLGTQDEDFGTVSICEFDLFAYAGPEFDENGDPDPNKDGTLGWQCPTAFVPGLNECSVITAEDCEYTQTIFIIELLNSEPERFDTVVCSEWEFLGVQFPAENYVERPFFLSPDILNANDCDTFIDLYAWYMNIGGLLTGDCITGANGQPAFALTLDTFDISDASPDNTTLITVDWYWEGLGFGEGFEQFDGDPDGNPFTFVTEESGLWQVVVTMTVPDDDTGEPLPGCKFVFDIDVDPSIFLPQDPVPGPWNLMPCAAGNPPLLYTITSGPEETPIWIWPSDVTSATGQGTDTLTVDWNGSAGGEIGVFVTNECGVSDTITAIVTLIDVPDPVISIDLDTTCVDSVFTITSVGPTIGGEVYTWGFSGGVVQGGPAVGPGPHQVIWPSVGDFEVTLQINIGDCVSTIVRDTVAAVGPIAVPVITCGGSTNSSASFTWAPVPGAIEYIVEVIMGPTPGVVGSQTNTDYTVTGMNLNDGAIIQVTAVTDNPCGNTVGTSAECFSQDCPTETITLTSVDDTLCFEPTLGLSTIDVAWLGGSVPPGSGEFTGPGIDDVTLAEFNPISAGIGTHTVVYTFTGAGAEYTGCVYSAAMTFVVLDIPQGLISPINPNCIEDNFGSATLGSAVEGEVYEYVVNGTTTANPNLTGLAPGNYQVEFVNPTTGCSSVENFELVSAPTVTAEIHGPFVSISPSDTVDLRLLIEPIDTSAVDEIVWTATSSGEVLPCLQVPCFDILISPDINTEYCATVTYNGTCVIETCIEVRVSIDDCDLDLNDDFTSISPRSFETIDVLENDEVPLDYIAEIIDISSDIVNAELLPPGDLSILVEEPFADTLTITYEVCTPDCVDCEQAIVYIINADLEDIVQTTFLDRDNTMLASLKFNNSEILEDSELWIYNRWGQKIFYAEDYGNDWDGSGYPAGIYYYVLKVRGVTIKQTLTIFD